MSVYHSLMGLSTSSKCMMWSMNKFFAKGNYDHNKKQKLSHPVKGIIHIQLNDHSFSLSLSLLECVDSYTKIILPSIFLLSTNRPWFLEISFCNIGFNLFAIILEVMLYKTLHKEIGQNVAKLVGLVSLGIRAKRKSLCHPPSWNIFGHTGSFVWNLFLKCSNIK